MRKGVIEVTVVCELDQEYFAPWEDLTLEQQAIFKKRSTNCDGVGYLSQGCVGCDFCHDTELEDWYLEEKEDEPRSETEETA